MSADYEQGSGREEIGDEEDLTSYANKSIALKTAKIGVEDHKIHRDHFGNPYVIGFGAKGQEKARHFIMQNMGRPFFGNQEYNRRVQQCADFSASVDRLRPLNDKIYSAAIADSHDSLNEIRVRRDGNVLEGSVMANSMES